MSHRSWPELRHRLSLALLLRVQWPRVVLYRLLSLGRRHGRPRLYQPLLTPGRGAVWFDSGVTIGFFPSPHFFSTIAHIEARTAAATIRIGEGTWINNNFCAIAEHTQITLGRRVLVGTGVEIYDSDFHGLTLAERNTSKPERARPVVIEDDVFIGSNARILKGVRIGAGSVISNGAVVVSDVPPGVVAGGNPARVLKSIGA